VVVAYPSGGDPLFDAGLPAGTAARAIELAASAAAAASTALGRPVDVDERAVMRHLHLPYVVGRVVELRSSVVRVAGGAVHADLHDDDVATFEELSRAMDGADPEELSAVAQEWRLPVTPYRASARPVASDPAGATSVGTSPELAAPRPPDAVRVVDLTSMWAGPLCTWLLASLGCEVVTIEAPCRPDGLRGSPGHFETLAAGKRRLPLDLRRSEDRSVFERLVATADLVVESYSSRVMSNFGYEPEALRGLRPTVTTLSIRAFDREPDERDWVAYGPGVHAASGHGVTDGEPRPATHAYADALTGLAAASAAWRVLGLTEPPSAVTVGMDRVIHGLGPTLPPPDAEAIGRLVSAIGAAGHLPLTVEGGRRG
jgi:hypothetical protein